MRENRMLRLTRGAGATLASTLLADAWPPQASRPACRWRSGSLTYLISASPGNDPAMGRGPVDNPSHRDVVAGLSSDIKRR